MVVGAHVRVRHACVMRACVRACVLACARAYVRACGGSVVGRMTHTQPNVPLPASDPASLLRRSTRDFHT